MASQIFFPPSPKDALIAEYLGKSLHDVPAPAAVIDVAAVRRNCQRMLEACESLDLEWRAHVKTHKTVELTRFQVGDDPKRPAKLIVSTIAEVEFLLPLLQEYKSEGRSVNVLYGLPITPGAIPRLAAVAKTLGEGSISVLLDDPAQVAVAKQIQTLSGVTPEAHIKIEMGAKRAGVVSNSDRFFEVLDAALEGHKSGGIILSGLYSHAGHSYAGDSRAAAIKMLGAEFKAMLDSASSVVSKAKDKNISNLPPPILSAGASPTALSVQNLLTGKDSGSLDQIPELKTESDALSALFTSVRTSGHTVEIHAGVYPTLDLQQLSVHSLSTTQQSWRDVALTVLAEVHGTYPGRGVGGTDEMLIGAGIFALGREPCKAYPGMAMLTPWGRRGVDMPTCEVEEHKGWIVGRFSQEHGIVTWSGEEKPEVKPDALEIGQKVRLWPNHACITSSQFGWYFVVDESREGKEDEIMDIWIKARGW